MRWNFWRWLMWGHEGASGFRLLFWSPWTLVHLAIGFGLAELVDLPMHKAAQIFLLPLAGIFIGLSFAWAGNAQALLMEKEIELLADFHPDGIHTYVYTFQLAILVILVTLVAWGLAALKVLEIFQEVLYVMEALLYFLASLTVRECWHVVLGSQLLILARRGVRRRRNFQDDTSA